MLANTEAMCSQSVQRRLTTVSAEAAQTTAASQAERPGASGRLRLFLCADVHPDP